MTDDDSQAPQQPQGQPISQDQPPPAHQGGVLSEAEIQQTIADSFDVIHKGEDQHGVERR